MTINKKFINLIRFSILHAYVILVTLFFKLIFTLYGLNFLLNILNSNINFIKKVHPLTLQKAIQNLQKFFPNLKCIYTAASFKFLVSDSNQVYTFKLGIFKKNNKLESHAWITNQDLIILNDLKNLPMFKVIYTN